MFDTLSDKLSAVFKRLSSKGRLTEKDVDEALKEVRMALLEADVHFRVARDLTARVRERAMGQDVLQSITPAQQVIKIVHDELVAVLGGGEHKLLPAPQPPTIVMLAGLQGSGKTTTAAKVALHLKRAGQRPLLVAADLRRPAAVEQLLVLGKQLDVPAYSEGVASTPLTVCRNARKRAQDTLANWVILDTSGRLHIDEELMAELTEIKREVKPSEVLLVVDAMTGQDAVRVAQDFQTKVGLTGLILTKLDGDARGGAALSITSVTGVPIKFAGVGEKPDALEPFYPDRLASRILGMGDVVTLVEKAQQSFDEAKAREMEQKLRKATFDLADFLEQLQNLKKMGPLSNLLEMIPGFSQLSRRLPSEALDEGSLKRIEAIIYSMTPAERHNPDSIDGSRRRRIARGSGTTPADVNALLNQFRQTRQLMKQLSSGKVRGLPRLF